MYVIITNNNQLEFQEAHFPKKSSSHLSSRHHFPHKNGLHFPRSPIDHSHPFLFQRSFQLLEAVGSSFLQKYHKIWRKKTGTNIFPCGTFIRLLVLPKSGVVEVSAFCNIMFASLDTVLGPNMACHTLQQGGMAKI